LARHVPQISRPAVSQHLAVLREARLVQEERQGRFRIYRLNPEPLRQFWDGWLVKYQRNGEGQWIVEIRVQRMIAAPPSRVMRALTEPTELA
jgi:DNA-binding transcriptional ArsR family regulator